jgi:hypothetical protein
VGPEAAGAFADRAFRGDSLGRTRMRPASRDARTVGPIRPFSWLYVALLLLLALFGVYAYAVNVNIAGFLCNVDDVAARDACSGFAGLVSLQTSLFAAHVTLLAILLLRSVNVVLIVVVSMVVIILSSMLLGMWVSVRLIDISEYTRSVSFFDEADGLFVNIMKIILASAIVVTLVCRRRGRERS